MGTNPFLKEGPGYVETRTSEREKEGEKLNDDPTRSKKKKKSRGKT
jgi:hypothetical protein